LKVSNNNQMLRDDSTVKPTKINTKKSINVKPTNQGDIIEDNESDSDINQ